jgi:hypothetical protein
MMPLPLTYRKLQADIDQRTIDSLNHLMRKLHSESRILTRADFRNIFGRSDIYVAEDGSGEIRAVGLLVQMVLLTNDNVRIHNLSADADAGPETLLQIITNMVEDTKHYRPHINIHIDVECTNEVRCKHVEGLGFKQTSNYTYRLKGVKQKKKL